MTRPLFVGVKSRAPSVHLLPETVALNGLRAICGKLIDRPGIGMRRFGLPMDRQCRACKRVARAVRGRVSWTWSISL